jgi:DNA-binding response OmpR family regulator
MRCADMAELLLVDDDPRIAELCAWFLERRGHRVRRATSYADARVAIAEAAPALMLADLDLGRESGREELPRLAAEGLLPRTLVVSGYLDAALDRELRAIAGVVGTLSKPFDIDELVRRVGAALAQPAPPAAGASAHVVAPAQQLAEDEDGWTWIVPRGREPA